jgi:putative oxidoreductase
MKHLDKQWALLPLRLIIGFGFVAHGYAKLSRGPDKFAIILEGIGVPLPHVLAWITTLLEFVGGLSVMAGAFLVPLAVPLSAVMTVALVTVHLQYGFSSIRLKSISASGAEFGPIGYELNLVYIAGLLAIAFCGSTRLSLDHWLKTRRTERE